MGARGRAGMMSVAYDDLKVVHDHATDESGYFEPDGLVSEEFPANPVIFAAGSPTQDWAFWQSSLGFADTRLRFTPLVLPAGRPSDLRSRRCVEGSAIICSRAVLIRC